MKWKILVGMASIISAGVALIELGITTPPENFNQDDNNVVIGNNNIVTVNTLKDNIAPAISVAGVPDAEIKNIYFEGNGTLFQSIGNPGAKVDNVIRDSQPASYQDPLIDLENSPFSTIKNVKNKGLGSAVKVRGSQGTIIENIEKNE